MLLGACHRALRATTSSQPVIKSCIDLFRLYSSKAEQPGEKEQSVRQNQRDFAIYIHGQQGFVLKHSTKADIARLLQDASIQPSSIRAMYDRNMEIAAYKVVFDARAERDSMMQRLTGSQQKPLTVGSSRVTVSSYAPRAQLKTRLLRPAMISAMSATGQDISQAVGVAVLTTPQAMSQEQVMSSLAGTYNLVPPFVKRNVDKYQAEARPQEEDSHSPSQKEAANQFLVYFSNACQAVKAACRPPIEQAIPGSTLRVLEAA